MNVDDIVAAKVEAALARIEATKRRRAALAAARQRGLAHRHAAKLRHLARVTAPPPAPVGQSPKVQPDRGDTHPVADPTVTETVTTDTTEETVMTERTLTPGVLTALTDDIHNHGYAIVQTRIERVPPGYRSTRCDEGGPIWQKLNSEPDGCPRPATLVTLAVAEVVNEDNGAIGFSFARDGADEIVRITVCDTHRCQASHDLYYVLTGRARTDGIRAFDMPGQHLSWT
ncbi:hypothetical protein [Streptomyces sp. NBC_00212]|uniref:hypothetical protein n=1 Tax=Streptomyces sp. NBC_00212 TaxID=2975684 RepID=UPI00324D1A70